METNGWDTVFVAPVDRINAGLAASTAALVQDFSFSDPDYTISGKFGIWSITPFGSGKPINLRIMISAGTMRFT
jgi:hypothetical protein